MGEKTKSVMRSHTVTTFILLGLTDDPQLQVLLFIFLLLTDMLRVTWNLTIMTLIFVDSHLKKAMYFFLQNFSFLEVSFTSACILRYSYSIATNNRVITYSAYIVQVFFTNLFEVTGFYLLAAMSFDRYVSICKLLHYMAIMSSRVCRILILCSWMASLCVLIPPLSLSLKVEFFDSNIIDHFGCDAFPLVKISCSDTWSIQQTVIICAVLTMNMTLTCVVLSYAYILGTIFRFPSIQQRKNAFSTYSSHMIVVSITYGTCISIYMNPSTKEEVAINKVVSLLISSISPTLNPFIYTLRNNEVKETFKDIIKRVAFISTK